MGVYRGMDQETLERQYDARGSVDDFGAEIRRYRELSDDSYANCRVSRDLAYGDHPDECFDLFHAEEGAPVLVFLHGGYWRLLGRAESAFMARAMAGGGVAVAVVEYSLAPGASLDRIVDQVRRAVAGIRRDAGRHGIDPERIFVCGSSAGGHLGAMVLATDWEGGFGLPADTVKGGVLVSGLYDLEPVRLCLPNTWLNLDEESAARNSPIGLAPPADARIMVHWGEFETDEFKRQSRDYAEAARASGAHVTAGEIAGRNHFDVMVDLTDPGRLLFRETIAIVTGGPPTSGKEKP